MKNKLIAVYEDDPIRYHCNLNADASDAALRFVSPDEFNQLTEMVKQYWDYQALLKEIRERPEVEFDEAWQHQKDSAVDKRIG